MKLLLKKLFLLLFSILAFALPATSEELQEFVAGTEFEPNPRATHPFYLKEYGNSSTSNSSLAFNNATIFDQDIVVYDNVNYSNKLVHVNQNYNVDKYGYKAANSTTVPLNKYIVAKPSQVNKVGGLNVRKNDSYSNNGMFITKTETGKTTCVLYYTIKNLKKGEAYQVKVGFVNLANKTQNDGSLAVKLRYKIHGIKENGTIGNQLIENEWNLNTDAGIKNLETKSSQIIKGSQMSEYVGLVLTILNNGSEANHVFGLDYINVYSKNNIIVQEQTATPASINYEECVETPGKDYALSDLIRLPKTYTGTLKIYEDAALSKIVTTFNTGVVTNGPKTYYYTYQEEGKLISETGTLTVTVKGNETLIVKSNPSDATITCNNPDVTLSVSGASETDLFQWYGPQTGLSNTLNVSIKGNYTVEGIGSNGCPAYGAITVKENTTKPIITLIKSTDSKGNETNVVTCTEGTLTVTPQVSTSNVTYQWDNNKTTSSITETEKGVYTLIVKDKTNGCASEPKSITLDKDDTVPSVTITSFNSMESDADETNVLTCSNKEIYLVANVEPNDVTYIWQGDEANNKSNFKVTAPGEYTLKVVSNTNGCTLDGIKYEVKQDVENPTVSLRTEFNEDGTAGSTVFTCDRVEIKLVADTESSPVEIDSYKWSNNATIESWQVMDAPGVYSVVVTAKNGCDANAEITLTLDNSTPIATITQSADTITCDVISSTISATTDIESNYVWTFGDKTYTDVTEITVETKGAGSLKVTSKETGCEALPVNFTVEQSIEKPSVPVIDNAKLALCPETGNYDLSSFIKDKKNNITYTFYDESGEALSTAIVDTKTPNTQYSYTVVATAKNGCDSQAAEFDVVVDGFVDFDLVLSTTEPLVVGDDIVATVVPTGVEADAYTWQLNGDKVSEEGLEYSTKLYLDTEFLVTATSRCDVKTKTASVEVIWPTAFTPHNKNGKNDTFADGMKLMIFNRFYTKIYEGDNGWDGTINGSLNDSNEIAVPGVYYYSVQLPNGQVKKGTIEIIKVD